MVVGDDGVLIINVQGIEDSVQYEFGVGEEGQGVGEFHRGRYG